ncbi:MAG: chorismate-binding protein [Prevotella sp.]|nr:chorismate-binding protein [Prevotella sp.]
MMTAFAVYRLPREKECVVMVQRNDSPLELMSCTELNGKSGFVMCPFAVAPNQPILLLQPDSTSMMPVDRHLLRESLALEDEAMHRFAGHLEPEDERAAYARDFSAFHSCLTDGRFCKIVLARRCFEQGDEDVLQLFCKACAGYPQMFVSLVSMPQSGTWLMATPEVLLEGYHGQWRTVALAGTMNRRGNGGSCGNPVPDHRPDMHWSRKNIREQRYVVAYIKECLERYAENVVEKGPYTVQAAHLVHLCSDFSFTLSHPSCVGQLLEALHPTPAVCGLPKQETFRFIHTHESAARRYYSGFSGPLDVEGATHLFVSLRCMEMVGDGYCLHAGGGLLADSVEQQEWEETEAKMETMRRLLK